MNGPDPLLDEIIKLKIQLKELSLRHFFDRELFSWIWWVGIACIVIALIIWWILVDKKKLLEIGTFGAIVIAITIFFNVAGTELGLWIYRINMIKPADILIPVDFAILPAVMMILYQKFPKWGPFLLATAIMAAVLAFGVEPLTIWIGQYRLVEWRLIYSYPVYLVISITAKSLTGLLKSKQDLHNPC